MFKIVVGTGFMSAPFEPVSSKQTEPNSHRTDEVDETFVVAQRKLMNEVGGGGVAASSGGKARQGGARRETELVESGAYN
jgi:hypothetical protein